jgi:large subunit ribosomal protein L5
MTKETKKQENSINRLEAIYKEKIAPELVKEFKLTNVMQAPRLAKISVNIGIGPFRENREAVDSMVSDLTMFTGQKPSQRNARTSVAGFKVRQGDTVGYTVSLRGKRMWSFLDKLINVALPRVRDFRGLSVSSFDEAGNYSIGIKEHVIFPEVNPNATKGIRPLQVTLVIKGNNIEANRAMLKSLGMPFAKEEK